MLRKIRAIARSARSVAFLRGVVAIADRLWWAHIIRRADVVDVEFAASQGLPVGPRRAVRAYVRGAFRDGASLNPLFLEQLVSSQLSDAGRVPALYAYLVNDVRSVETSVSWDAPAYAAAHPDSLASPGGPLGHAWREARRSGTIELGRGSKRRVLAWRTVIAAARRSRSAERSTTTGSSGDTLVLRIGPNEPQIAATLHIGVEFVHNGANAVIAVEPTANAARREADLLPLWLPGVSVVEDGESVLARVAEELQRGDVLIVRGADAEISASDLLSLAGSASRNFCTVAPLWLDRHDGTVVSAGVVVKNGLPHMLLAGHPAEDAALLPQPLALPGLGCETFARPVDAPWEPVRTETSIVVRAPLPPRPEDVIRSFDPLAESDMDAILAPLGMRVVDWSHATPVLERSPRAAIVEPAPSLRWAIKIVAPPGARGEAWGDTHFARGLATALRRLGQEVVIDAYDARARPTCYLDDVVLALRGPEPFAPQSGATSLLWIISHPDQITAREVGGFDRVYAGSVSWARSASARFGREVVPLLQCTDASRFHPVGAARTDEIIFVGTARGIPRPSIIEPLRAGIAVSVYGPDWRGWIPAEAIKGTGIPNAELPAVYERASVVLNDHWPAMRKAGFVSNRLYDVVAAGGRVVSDHVEGIEEIFEGAVVTYRTVPELIQLLQRDPAKAFPNEETLNSISARVRERHSFDARARRLLDDALAIRTSKV